MQDAAKMAGQGVLYNAAADVMRINEEIERLLGRLYSIRDNLGLKPQAPTPDTNAPEITVTNGAIPHLIHAVQTTANLLHLLEAAIDDLEQL